MSKALYLDTSIFGGYFDIEFKSYTERLFDEIEKQGHLILLSTLTLDELSNAPLYVQDFLKNLNQQNIRVIQETLDAVDLANLYIEEKVVGKTSYADCLHIALATTNQADLLLSWNFKHIVNVTRILGYNYVNNKLGYCSLQICSPKNPISYEGNK